jgi:hypothetical protein
MTTHDDPRIQLTTRLGASLLGIAGAASLVYAIGFTHTWAYLRFFDAAVLISGLNCHWAGEVTVVFDGEREAGSDL